MKTEVASLRLHTPTLPEVGWGTRLAEFLEKAKGVVASKAVEL
jgi:hypothetical protein